MGGDSASKNAGIPSWQRTKPAADNVTAPIQEAKPEETTSEESSTHAQPSTQPNPTATPENSQESTLAQAAKFLQDESIQDAPANKKIAFLESKGLSKPDIEQAMNMSASDPTYSPKATPSTAQDTAPTSAPSPPSQTPLPEKNIPPIITYPEFLVHSQKPPPLITANRLLNTAYVATGIAAAIYGASTYLVAPMVEALTHARHDFAEHAHGQLKELNEKLGDVVSRIPDAAIHGSDAIIPASEADSDDSDPTELFHRDYGTQTSGELGPVALNSSDSSEAAFPLQTKEVESQTAKLNSLKAFCLELVNEESDESKTADQLTESISSLQEYLNNIAYPTSTYMNKYASFGEPSAAKNDEISNVQKEIRGVKGVLLSARNFPGGLKR